MYNNQYYQQQGMNYNQAYQAPLMTNALTPEMIKELKRANATNVIPQITKAEMYASQCTHRDPQKNCFAYVPAAQEGYVTCTICGETFKPVDMTKQQAEAIVEDAIDIAQTTKMNFIDMAPSAVAEYFKMIPLLKRLPELYQQSLNDFQKYDQGFAFQQNVNGNYFNAFAALTSPQMGNMYGQPMYNPQMQQQYTQQQMNGYQQPQFNPQMQQYGQPNVQQNMFYQQQPNMMQQNMCAPAPNPQQQNNVPNQNVKPEVKSVINA